MKSGSIYCEKCAGTIEHKADLIICIKGFTMVSYHAHCYATTLKGGLDSFIVSNTPINGSQYLTTAIVSSVILLGVSIFAQLWWALLFLLIPVGIRAWSWYLYERKLKT